MYKGFILRIDKDGCCYIMGLQTGELKILFKKESNVIFLRESGHKTKTTSYGYEYWHPSIMVISHLHPESNKFGGIDYKIISEESYEYSMKNKKEIYEEVCKKFNIELPLKLTKEQ